MPIINKGIFDTDVVFQRQVGNDWPTAQVISTADVIEATSNLYFTDSRAISAVSPLLTTANVVEETNLYYTDERASSNTINLMQSFQGNNITIEANGRISASASAPTTEDILNALLGSNVTLNDLIVSGDLTVQGNTVTLNVATLTVEDKTLLLANGAADAATADGSGIVIDGAQANITFENATDAFVTNKNFTVLGNVFVDSITSNAYIGLIAGDNIEIDQSNGRISAVVANVSFANTVQSISNFTSDDLSEGNVSLYYNNTRVRSAFSAGAGITITAGGIIAATDSRPSFNLNIDGSTSYTVTDTMANVVVFPQNADTTLRYSLKSIHVTNLSEDTAYISGNFIFLSSNTVPFADLIPMPYGTSLEFLRREQGFGQLDAVQLQGFDQDRNPASNVISATLTHETLYLKEGVVGSGLTMVAGNVDYELWNSNAFFTIVESIKLVNLDDTTVRARVAIADANNAPLSYFAYNLALPAKTSVEVLQGPKKINITNKVITALNNDANVAAIISLRKGGEVSIGTYTETPAAGGNVELEFNTNLPEGTQVFYTIE